MAESFTTRASAALAPTPVPGSKPWPPVWEQDELKLVRKIAKVLDIDPGLIWGYRDVPLDGYWVVTLNLGIKGCPQFKIAYDDKGEPSRLVP